MSPAVRRQVASVAIWLLLALIWLWWFGLLPGCHIYVHHDLRLAEPVLTVDLPPGQDEPKEPDVVVEIPRSENESNDHE